MAFGSIEGKPLRVEYGKRVMAIFILKPGDYLYSLGKSEGNTTRVLYDVVFGSVICCSIKMNYYYYFKPE